MHIFKIGDKVVATGNYNDEQLGEYAPKFTQVVKEIQDVSHLKGTSGQWIKTDVENDWVDSAWFRLVDKRQEKENALDNSE